MLGQSLFGDLCKARFFEETLFIGEGEELCDAQCLCLCDRVLHQHASHTSAPHLFGNDQTADLRQYRGMDMECRKSDDLLLGIFLCCQQIGAYVGGDLIVTSVENLARFHFRKHECLHLGDIVQCRFTVFYFSHLRTFA